MAGRLHRNAHKQHKNRQHKNRIAALVRTLGGIGVPVMYQGGTRDIGITPFVRRSGGAYDQSRAPKYFVEFNGAGHLAWTDLRDVDHAAIVEYTRAFLDRYLKGGSFPDALASPHDGVADVRISE